MPTIVNRAFGRSYRATIAVLAFATLGATAAPAFGALSFSIGQTVKATLLSPGSGGSTIGDPGATFRLYTTASSSTYTEQWGSNQGGLFKWNNVFINGTPQPGETFLTSCIEVVQNISYGGTFTYTVADLATAPIGGSSTPMTNATANLIQALFNNSYPGVSATNQQAGAFQIALWKLVYDGGFDATTNNFLSGGRLRLTNGSMNSNAMVQSAITMLTGITPASSHPNVLALTSGSSQDQLWGIVAPVVDPQVGVVPEPASLVVWSVLAGGAAGLAMKGRRKASAKGRWSPEAREAIFDIVQGRVGK